jgi:ATP-dependent Clp protease ATP-binding subunit ClpC
MYERFSSNARQVLVTASADTRSLGHAETGTAHLLLALTQVDAWVADLLMGHGLTRDTVAALVSASMPAGGAIGPGAAIAPVPLAMDGRKAIEAAADMAAEEGDGQVHPHHLLLGVLDVGGGAATVLTGLEVDAVDLRHAVVDVALPRPADPSEPVMFEPGRSGATTGQHEGAGEVPARCPGCRRQLAAELAGSVHRVTGRPDIEVVVVSCPSCGRVLAHRVERRA